MAIKHFKASEHSPESASALKLEGWEHVSMTTIDKIVQSQATNKEHCLLPTVFTIEQGQPIPAKALGPGAAYVIEGELLIEDTDDPEKPLHLTAGDVSLVDEGTIYKTSTPSKARVFAIAYMPASFVLKDVVLQDKA